MNMFDTEDLTTPPITLDLLAADFEHTSEGVVTVTLFDALGVRIALPMARAKAKAFGLSLAEWAAT